jgi:hypothetical protein
MLNTRFFYLMALTCSIMFFASCSEEKKKTAPTNTPQGGPVTNLDPVFKESSDLRLSGDNLSAKEKLYSAIVNKTFYTPDEAENMFQEALEELHLSQYSGDKEAAENKLRYLKGLNLVTEKSFGEQGSKAIYEKVLAAIVEQPILYNRDYVNAFDVLTSARLQCSSASMLYYLSLPSNEAKNLYFMFTKGHVFTGYAIKEEERIRLYGLEITNAGEGLIDIGYADELDFPIRIVPARIYAFFKVFAQNLNDIEDLASKALEITSSDLGFDLVKTEGKVNAPLRNEPFNAELNQSIFGFGVSSTPAGDLARGNSDTSSLGSAGGITAAEGKKPPEGNEEQKQEENQNQDQNQEQEQDQNQGQEQEEAQLPPVPPIVDPFPAEAMEHGGLMVGFDFDAEAAKLRKRVDELHAAGKMNDERKQSFLNDIERALLARDEFQFNFVEEQLKGY